jgi:hypothetical protein
MLKQLLYHILVIGILIISASVKAQPIIAKVPNDQTSKELQSFYSRVLEMTYRSGSYAKLSREEKQREKQLLYYKFTRFGGGLNRKHPIIYGVIYGNLAANWVLKEALPEDYCLAANTAQVNLEYRKEVIDYDEGLYLSWLKEEIGFEEVHLEDLFTSVFAEKMQIRFSDCCVGDRDQDGVCDRDDWCPNEAGAVESNGCPPCADMDGDLVCDSADVCPQLFGAVDNQGCPEAADEPAYVYPYMNGTISVGEDFAAFKDNSTGLIIQRSSLVDLINDLMDKEISDTDQLHFGEAMGFSYNEKFVGSSFYLRTINYVNELGKSKVLFPPKQYTVSKESNPELYGENFERTFKGVIELIKFLVDELEIPKEAWSIDIQGGADRPTFLPARVKDEVLRSQINAIDFMDYDGITNEYIKSGWILGRTYTNPDLPNSRAGWILTHLLRQPFAASYKENFRAVEGLVTDHYAPEERNVTIFFVIDQEALKAAARRLVTRVNSGETQSRLSTGKR